MTELRDGSRAQTSPKTGGTHLSKEDQFYVYWLLRQCVTSGPDWRHSHRSKATVAT